MQEYTKTKLNKVIRGSKRATYDVEKINAVLDAGYIGYVSYIYEGQAISLPMLYARDGGKIYLHSSLKNRMFLALLASEEMSMTVMHLDALVLARSGLHHSVNYRSATIFGKLNKVEDREEKLFALEAMVNNMVPNRWNSLRSISEKEIKSTLVVELIITNASAKIRDVGVQDEKADESLPIWAGLVPIRQIAELPISDELLSEDVEIPDHVLEFCEKNKA